MFNLSRLQEYTRNRRIISCDTNRIILEDSLGGCRVVRFVNPSGSPLSGLRMVEYDTGTIRLVELRGIGHDLTVRFVNEQLHPMLTVSSFPTWSEPLNEACFQVEGE